MGRTRYILILFACCFFHSGLSAQQLKAHSDTLTLLPSWSEIPAGTKALDPLLVSDFFDYYSLQEVDSTYTNPIYKDYPVTYYMGEPFANGLKRMVYFNPGELIYNYDRVFIPTAIRFYQNAAELIPVQQTGRFHSEELCTNELSDYFQPFYFSKHEVTNIEYREFITWVKDSLARRILAEEFPEEFLRPTDKDEATPLLNWDKEFKYWDAAYVPLLTEMYLPDHERFYRRKEIDIRKLNYVYYTKNEKGEQLTHTLNVYPDTLSWVNYTNSFSADPLANMYAWHPAYDFHPVVGINYHQAKAFCHWKTIKLQKDHNRSGSKYRITVELPSEIEWDIAANHFPLSPDKDYRNRDGELAAQHVADNSWITDLALYQDAIYPQVKGYKYPITKEREDSGMDSLTGWRLDLVRTILNRQNNFKSIPGWDFIHYTQSVDLSTVKWKRWKKNKGYEFTQKHHGKDPRGARRNIGDPFNVVNPFYDPPNVSDQELKLLAEDYATFLMEHVKMVGMGNVDHNNISGLGNNVSEWLKENYNDNWMYTFEKRQEMLMLMNGSDATIVALIEKHFNHLCDTDGQLVRGANWLDERFSTNYNRNVAGQNAKSFVSPNKAYPTLGFRYVIHFEEK
jgi:hypothetical protein